MRWRIRRSAWRPFFLDHDQRSYRLISRVFAGQAADHAYLRKDPDTIATLSRK